MARRAWVDSLQRESQQLFQQQQLRRWLGSVPSEYRDHDPEQLKQRWMDRVTGPGAMDLRTWIRRGEQRSKFLVLWGTKGLGKSSVAVTIATELLRRERIVPRYESVPGLLQRISDIHAEGNPVDECRDARLLILDDVGAVTEGVTAHQRRAIWSIIEHRWAYDDLPTIITTNMSLGASSAGIGLDGWFGESAWDRISSSAVMVQFRGDSLRDLEED